MLEPPDSASLSQAPGACQVEGSTIRISLGSDQSVNEAVQWLASLGPLRSLTTRDPSLHDIYLDKLKESVP